MKIEITKSVRVKEEIDIEFPYYYSYGSMLYGKIDGGRDVTISISHDDGTTRYELEVEAFQPSRVNSQVDPKNKSTEAEYLEAKAKMLAALQGA